MCFDPAVASILIGAKILLLLSRREDHGEAFSSTEDPKVRTGPKGMFCIGVSKTFAHSDINFWQLNLHIHQALPVACHEWLPR